jgi:phosphatidylglycerophosphate synthase
MVAQHLPNLLSISRIPAALILLATYRFDSPSRALLLIGLVVMILVTDLIDGRIARRFGTASKVGYLLDGLGDRAVHVAAYLLLVMAEVLPVVLAWALMFREICQYGVRIVELDWHGSQSAADRAITRVYMIAVHAALLGELIRTAAAPGHPPGPYVVAVSTALSLVAISSYARIVPRLVRALRTAVEE